MAELKHLAQDEFEEFVNSKEVVLIDFYATWCKNCKYMDKNILSAPEVAEKLKNFTVIKFQAEDLKNPEIIKILKHFNIQGLPSFVILEKNRGNL